MGRSDIPSLKLLLDLFGSLDVDIVGRRLMVHAAQRVPAAFTAVLLKTQLIQPDDQPRLTSTDDVLADRLWQLERPLIIPNTAEERVWDGLLAEIGPSGLLMPLIHQSPVGILILGAAQPHTFTKDHIQALAPMVSIAAAALGHATQYLEAVQHARLKERRQLAQQLHDTISQTIYAANTIAELLPRMVEKNPQKTQVYMRELEILTRAAMADVRTLMIELHPEAIGHTELNVLLKQLCDASAGRMRIPVVYEGTGKLFLAPQAHTACYRIVQEALANIAQHAQATAVTVQMSRQKNMVELRIIDNGQGFTPAEVSDQATGLAAIRAYAGQIGAVAHIHSQPNQGTVVSVEGIQG